MSEGKPEKHRLLSIPTFKQPNVELSQKYQYVSVSIRKVQPEYFKTIYELKSNYIMSETHAVTIVVIVKKTFLFFTLADGAVGYFLGLLHGFQPMVAQATCL